MKLKSILIFAFSVALMNCSAKVDAPKLDFQTPQEDTSFPKYLFQDIKGTVYNQPWTVQTAVVRNFGTSGQTGTVDLARP